jgi:hypothetical protein
MDVERIRQARARAEQELQSILAKLETETGLSVTEVRVERVDVSRLEDEARRTALSSVSVSLDLRLD